MADEATNGVIEETIRRLDAEYAPFPSFSDWTGTGVLAMDLFDHHARLLAQERSKTDEKRFGRALEVIVRAAAFDTGALEGLYQTDRGFTFTVVAHQSLSWERSVTARSDVALPLFKAQLETYELLLDAATAASPITEVWIRWVHESLCKAHPYYDVRVGDRVEPRPLRLGEYKRESNHVFQADGTPHSYAPVADTPGEVARLVAELNSQEFEAAHPIHQAAYAHYCLVAIHPFADGNGRVARAIASVFLYRALSLPFVVLIDHRKAYLDALEAVDRGEHGVFDSFVLHRVLDGIEFVLDILNTEPLPPASEMVTDLRKLLTVAADLTHQAMDDLAWQLGQQLTAVLQSHLAALGLPRGVSYSVDNTADMRPPEQGEYRGTIAYANHHTRAIVGSAAPALANQEVRVYPFVAVDRSNPFPFVLRSADERHTLRFRLDEIHPAITPTAQVRLQRFAEHIAAKMLADVIEQARGALRNSGYER